MWVMVINFFWPNMVIPKGSQCSIFMVAPVLDAVMQS
jgi:hypothetical protein